MVNFLRDTLTNDNIYIQDVWAHNLEAEIGHICDIVSRYCFVSMDTEFPGVVVRPDRHIEDDHEQLKKYQYDLLEGNVNKLKIIQLGLTFCDAEGNLPEQGPTTWQFHFHFDLDKDMYHEESIKLLKSAGIDFSKHKDYGINVEEFGALLIESGLVLLDNVRWIAFHSCYDFAYLLKVLIGRKIPNSEKEFFSLLLKFFPKIYDVKWIMQELHFPQFGLSRLAEELLATRVGPTHQAGSDSLLTASVFFKLKDAYAVDLTEIVGTLYGLGRGFVHLYNS
ncbi:hypothetical protein RCL1_004717 [Eukaryota sp. TZLM3-RCL]